MKLTSIDRKILRCQREIEAAKPKGLSFEEFEKGSHPTRYSATLYGTVSEADCRQIKGAAKETDRPGGEAAPLARRSPEAAPPSVQKFKPGDRVKTSEEEGTVFVLERLRTDPDRLFPGQWDAHNDKGRNAVLDPELMELIPSPASETEGWVAHDGGECPCPHARVHVKKRNGRVSSGKPHPAHLYGSVWRTDPAMPLYPEDIVAYKVIA